MGKREKIAPISILLREPEQINRALSIIANLPVDGVKPLQVLIREAPRGRGLSANALMWVRLGEIAEQAWMRGRQYSAEVWHEYCKRAVMPDIVTLRDGIECSKWEDTPDGGVALISTSRLEKRCFAEYIQAIEAFGAGLGVQFSAREW